MTLPETNLQQDTAEARAYNRARRLVEIGDLAISFGFLIVLLATGWSIWLRDLSVRMARDHYIVQLFYYILLLRRSEREVDASGRARGHTHSRRV